MTETHEQRVERLAEAMWRADGIRDLGREPEGPWAQISDVWRDEYRDFARAIIASDREAGLVTVPKRPGKRACLVAQSYLVAAMTDSGSTYPGLDSIGDAIAAAIAAHEQEER